MPPLPRKVLKIRPSENEYKSDLSSLSQYNMTVCNTFHTSDQRSRQGYISYVAQLARLHMNVDRATNGQ